MFLGDVGTQNNTRILANSIAVAWMAKTRNIRHCTRPSTNNNVTVCNTTNRNKKEATKQSTAAAGTTTTAAPHDPCVAASAAVQRDQDERDFCET